MRLSVTGTYLVRPLIPALLRPEARQAVELQDPQLDKTLETSRAQRVPVAARPWRHARSMQGH